MNRKPLTLLLLILLLCSGCISSPIATPIQNMTPQLVPYLVTTTPVFNITQPTSAPTSTPAQSELSGYVVFDDTVGDNNQIFILNLDTRDISQLTNHGSNYNPVWSPDGTKIAYVSSPSRGGNSDIYIMNADGTMQIPVVKCSGQEHSPAWSPDSSKLAFVSDCDGFSNEIYVLDIQTSNITQLTKNTNSDLDPAWSPDGARIAFAEERGVTGFMDIFIMNADGTNKIHVVEGGPAWHPVWCPDETCMIYEFGTGSRGRIRKLMAIDLQSGEIKPFLSSYANDFVTDIWLPSLSPIRGYVVFNISFELYAMDLESKKLFSLGLHALNGKLYP